MSYIDWIVMFGTLIFIGAYGIYKTRQTKNIDGYLRGNNENNWWGIGLSVMATQASAVTFLSLPGQAFDDGMRFVQFYFGLPIAMIIICVFFIPMYYRLKVYTAYEFLENRFDYKTRALTAILFLIQRAMGAGITIYAPAIILSQLLHWDLNYTIIFIGTATTLYIILGGSKAIAITHKQQMAVIFLGMFVAFGYLIYYLSQHMNISQMVRLSGDLGKLNMVNFNFNWNDKYNIWSGIIGGLFLQLSYFGADQSQVGRYLGGQSIKQSRLGLLMNGLLKIPMQLFILSCGILVFLFYQFNQPPVYFDEVALNKVRNSEYADSLNMYEQQLNENFIEQSAAIDYYLNDMDQPLNININKAQTDSINKKINQIVTKVNPGVNEDHDFVFMTFVLNYLPAGLIGLLFAVIFCASFSSKSSEINALAATFVVDIYKRKFKKSGSDEHYLNASKLATLFFALLAVGFALISSLFDNLIEAVNIIGSLFYGTILGVFLTAFLLKSVKGNAVFIAAVISEIIIIYIDQTLRHPEWGLPTLHVGYLWYNVIGCFLVMGLSFGLQAVWKIGKPKSY